MKYREQIIIEEFESAFAKFVGTKYAVSVNSGFSALLVSLKAFGIGPGDKVIVPDYTFIATATAVTLAGAIPVFIDVTEDALLDPQLVGRRMRNDIKAIIPVHLYGRKCDMKAFEYISKIQGIPIIEDCAEAIGTKGVGRKYGCWSFHFAKTISTEQGGMITTDDKEFADKCRALAGYAQDPLRNYFHTAEAYNFRMTSMQAQKGLDALERIDIKLENMRWKGRKLAKHYGEKPQDNYWVFVSKHLEQYDRPGFVPLHLQPFFAARASAGSFPVSERLSKELKYIFL